MTLGIEILILLSPEGFEERFYFYAKTEKTYLKAYEKTELEYQNYFGKTKYSNYDSFRVVMQRKIKNKK